MRGLKVWFALRKSLVREMFGGKPLTVKAVDGVSFDVRRGEVFCLVGESGCGKTSTGKAILRLVDATEGDVFYGAPDAEYADYEANLRSPTPGPDIEKAVDDFRRKYSLTWTETLPWKAVQILLLAGFVTAGFLAGLLVPSLIMGYLTTPYTNSGLTLGVGGVLTGLLVGLVGSLPPTRPYRRTVVALALLALLAVSFAPVLAYTFNAAASGSPAPDALTAIGNAWGGDVFGLLMAWILAPISAGGVSRAIISYRQQAEGLTGIRMRTLRKHLQLIFQDPYESLNPKQSVYEIVSEPLQVNRLVQSPDEASAVVMEALNDAGLRPPEEFMFRFPHELSGGQRQRVSVASALVLQPEFIVADEPVSMLDVSVRTQILQLMMELRSTRRITYLFITHDLGLAWVLADRVAVMYLGKIVEQGTTDQVIAHPKHPYTQALISVVPSPNPRHKASRQILKGERPDPVDIPTGCRFHPRCPMAFAKCGWNADELKDELDATPSIRAGAMTVADPRTLRIATASGSPQELVDALLALAREKRDRRFVFRGIEAIVPGTNEAVVTMHAYEEPGLLEVAPENSVACFLIEPPRPAETAVALPP